MCRHVRWGPRCDRRSIDAAGVDGCAGGARRPLGRIWNDRGSAIGEAEIETVGRGMEGREMHEDLHTGAGRPDW